MITDIPSPKEFIEVGLDLLNLACNSFLDIQYRFDSANFNEWDTDGEDTNKYWKAEQRSLFTALAIVQQAAEFILKGRIAKVSPFLLITGNLNEWPRKCDKTDKSFADFKTIDAQDLIRVHNTVAEQRLKETFYTHFEDLRRLRNTVMHTVNKQLQITTKDLIIAILETNYHLIDTRYWIQTRQEYFKREPSTIAFSDKYNHDALADEITLIIDMLEPSDVKRFFGFNKRQRRYICPNCAEFCRNFENPNLAQLKPNTSNSTNIYCILCGENREVVRQDCRYDNCKGNVIDKQGCLCLTCNHDQLRASIAEIEIEDCMDLD